MIIKRCFIVITACMLVFPVVGAELVGRITKVVDGDTVIVESGDRLFTVRLNHIDAPEKNQSYGKEAAEHKMGGFETTLDLRGRRGCSHNLVFDM